jgi:hypothetical protein
MLQTLHGHRVNFVTLAIVGGLSLSGYLLHLRSQDQASWPWLLSIGISLSFFATLFNYWRYLKVSEAPISTIAAAAQGYVELQGTASTAKFFRAFPVHGIAPGFMPIVMMMKPANATHGFWNILRVTNFFSLPTRPALVP